MQSMQLVRQTPLCISGVVRYAGSPGSSGCVYGSGPLWNMPVRSTTSSAMSSMTPITSTPRFFLAAAMSYVS